MLQMSIAFQPPPQVVLTSGEMLASERIDHVGRDLCRIRVIIPKEIVVRRGNVGEEREREVREDGHETVVFIHPGQGFGRQLSTHERRHDVNRCRAEVRTERRLLLTSRALPSLSLKAWSTRLIW